MREIKYKALDDNTKKLHQVTAMELDSDWCNHVECEGLDYALINPPLVQFVTILNKEDIYDYDILEESTLHKEKILWELYYDDFEYMLKDCSETGNNRVIKMKDLMYREHLGIISVRKIGNALEFNDNKK